MAESARILKDAGFTQIKEEVVWNEIIKPSGKYFITRGGSSLIAFTIGKEFDAKTSTFKMIGTHTDSPAIRLAPKSKTVQNGFIQACIQTYGGGLWTTWMDRDLLIGGRVVINDGGELKMRLYQSDGPIAFIPNLCVHFNEPDAGCGVKIDKEYQLRPVFSHQSFHNQTGSQDHEDHYSILFDDICQKLNCKREEIMDFDLCFADAHKPAVIGFNKEFIASPRLDNLFSSYSALEAITIENDSKHINVAALFDHEEIGSTTITGADSQLLPSILERIFASLSGKEDSNALFSAYRRSFLISADMAHSVHPNYSSKHHDLHKVEMNKGVVLKINANNRYTTNALSGAFAKVICNKIGVPYQSFIVKQNSPCGSTIGPMLSAKLGVNCIDVGIAQFAMHSCRELCGVLDCHYYKEFFLGFYKNEPCKIDMDAEII